MRRYMLLCILMIVVVCLVAEDGFLWEANGKPLVVSSSIRWNGGGVRGTDGGEMLVWSEAVEDNHDLFGMRLDADGQNVWSEPRLFLDDISAAIDPRIVISSDGYLYISWLTGNDSDNQILEFSKFDWEGSMLWTNPVELSPVTWDFRPVEMISDGEGGVYLFWDHDGMWCAQRVNGNGQSVWSPEQLPLFDQFSYISSDLTTYPDGQGGFIVACTVYTGDNGFMAGIMRVMPDGSMPWGDDGCIILPESNDMSIYRYNDTEIAFASIEDTDTRDLYLYRLNLDGEFLTDEPLLIDEDLSWGIKTGIASDSEENLYVEWMTYDENYFVNTVKITPDNQFSWDQPFSYDNVLSHPYDFNIGIDQAGNIYESWMSNSQTSIQILKLTTNGELVWSDDVVNEPNHYETYIDLVMEVDDEGAKLFWADGRNGHETIYKQKYSSDGVAQWQEDEQKVEQGWDCSLQYLCTAEDERTRVNELFFAWKNYYDGSCYIQNVQPDGETGFLKPGFVFSDISNYENEVVAVEPIDGNYLIVWLESYDETAKLLVNLFDLQGNRQWQENLLVEEFNTSQGVYTYSLTAEFHDGELLICWGEYAASWSCNLLAQKIVNGQLAWEEPVVVTQSSDLTDIMIVDDYILCLSNNELHVTRLDENGDPCAGWNDNGIDIGAIYYFQRIIAKVTSEGLLLVWRMEVDETEALLYQIVHEDGTLKWETSLILVSPCDAYTFDGSVVDDMLYLVWIQSNSVVAQIFDLDGTPQWLLPATIDTGTEGLYDICPTSEGMLVTYVKYQDDSYFNELFLNHVDIDGNVWNNPLIVCNASRYRYTANIIPTQDDKYFITWFDYRDEISGDSYFGQLYQYQPTGTDDPENITPWNPELVTYPNPFNPETTVQFSLANKAKVELNIYNVKGQLVQTLCNEILPSGVHHIKWDGTDRFRKDVSSGVYLVNLNINGKDYRSKALLLK